MSQWGSDHATADWALAYDGDGVRTTALLTPYVDGQAQTPELTHYFFGGAYEMRADATVRKYYSFAGQMIAMRDADGLKYFLTDHLGSVVATTDDHATILQEQRYLPFGEVREDVGEITETELGYTGQRNLDMGLMDYKARFYSATVMRFTQPDTLLPAPANPQSLNRNSYVLNGPIRYADPSGHWIDEGCGSGALCELPKATPPPPPSGQGDAPNWPDNPSWDHFPAPLGWKTDPIEILFDPWAGYSYRLAFTAPDEYYAQIGGMRYTSGIAYQDAGIDLQLVVERAGLGFDNPLTELQAIDLIPSLLIRMRWQPYNAFLEAMGLHTGPAYITNYEPRFLEGLYVRYPKVLTDLLDSWRMFEAREPIAAEIREYLRMRGGPTYPY